MDPEDLTTLELQDEDPPLPDPQQEESTAPGMKRTLGDEPMNESGDEKRHAGSSEVLLRLLCPAHLTGGIIGKGGEAINQMRSETGCKIQVEGSVPGCEERVINITADDSPSQALCPSQSALLRVVEKLNEAAGEDSELFAVRLLAFKSQIGGVIGKGGQSISELRSSTGAEIRVMPKHDVPSCASADDEVVQVVGPYGRVHHAVQEISAKLRENPPREKPSARGAPLGLLVGAPGAAGGTPFGIPHAHIAHQHHMAAAGSPQPLFGLPLPGAAGVEARFKMVLPVAKAGTVIGRGGEVIKRVREETGATVTIHAAAPGSTFRVVEISSVDPAASPFCAAQEALLRCYHLANAAEPLGSAKLIVDHPSVGAILGKGGGVIQSLRQETGASIRVFGKDSRDLPEGLGPDDEMVQVEGNPYCVDAALRGVTLRIRSSTKIAAPMLPQPPMAAGLAAGTGFHHSPSRPPHHADQGPQDSVTLHVSKDMAGGIIGKGGSNISQIRQISGAHVQMRDPDPQTGTRALEIRGTAQQVQSAQSLVQAFLYSSGYGALEGS